ncbi:DJ-1/PfpI family protein [Desulfospira joergensenii]|uniref:DJ-1/PfpI family protein n=1 Tax=Desulfospira joergensenii TaxID=53329 RepID=UPI0003B5FA4B|nr:DJ-1/PfpI family protein [Desulfospira joergensenii]
MNIGIYIYDQAEVLDFSGPFEVFTTASRVCPDSTPFEVFLIGETGKTVSARAGFRIHPAYGFHNHPAMDLLIVVGGYHYDEMKKPHVLDWIAEQAGRARYVASICSGAWLLAQSGVLTDQNVTTHWEDIESLQRSYPCLKVHKNQRWIDEGEYITSAGISAGIDMSLYLVGKYHSLDLARKTARQMEYEWRENRES